MPVYRLDIAYDGTDFRGYAEQRGQRTVQEVLEEALARAMGPVATAVAGRTDAGVHAARQVVSVVAERPTDIERLKRSLQRLLPVDVSVLDCVEEEVGFDARFSASSRTYRYYVLNRPVPDPLLRRTTWHVPRPLDRGAMNAAASHFVGRHDFSSLCRRNEGRSMVREVLLAGWREVEQGLLCFEVTATSFCHQMVRSMAALTVEVGRGRIDPEEVPGILVAEDRNAARGAAPPHGLVLWDVRY